MKRLISFCALALVSAACFSNDAPPENIQLHEREQYCEPIFQQYLQQHPYDLSVCEANEPAYDLLECRVPDKLTGRLPTTHIILALDASGSMAGRVGSKTKMQVAKSEALAFMQDLHQSTKVSLVVYGHQGDGSDERKEESCNTIDVVHKFGASKASLKKSINDLKPAGWTPLAGVLNFIGEQVNQLPETDGKDQTTPVVYLISDGKETCDQDPVAAAQALAYDGFKTRIHTIGFDADKETQAQLKAIAEVGGGEFYLAETAQALQEQLNAIKDAEGQLNRYNYCVGINESKISGAFQKVSSEMQRCYFQNGPADFEKALQNAYSRAPDGSVLQQCALYFSDRLLKHDPDSNIINWSTNNIRPWAKLAVEKSKQYRQEAMQLLSE